MPLRLCFVDLETTGSNPLTDAITEVAIVSVDEHGAVEEWSTLLNPQQDIPPFIQNLTGITPAMVAGAPLFEQVAAAIHQRLQGQLFIAHNARFDYGFLRAAFRRSGLTLKATVLCTVKLSRLLDPREARHNLDSLIARHQLPTGDRHRALSDARVLWELWQHLQRQEDAERLQQAISELTRRPNLPPHLDADVVDELPTGCGVYVCHGENDEPLYVGSSLHLKHRVLSHFSAARPSAVDVALAQGIRRISWYMCAGETGALLLEQRLLQQLRPPLNPRPPRHSELCAWLWQPELAAAPRLIGPADAAFARMQQVHGLYRSPKDAQKGLRRLAEKHGLCLKLLGLEKGKAGQPCLGRVAKNCHGACIGRESVEQHQQRVQRALAELKVAAWPYSGRIGLREYDERTRQVAVHWVEHWCYLGSSGEQQVCAIDAAPVFDIELYRILNRALKHWPPANIIIEGEPSVHTD